MRTQFPIVGSFGQERNPALEAERTINMFEIDLPTGHWPRGEKRTALLSAPGSEEKITFASGSNGRATFVDKLDKDVSFAVIENKVYEIDSAFVATLLGTINTTSGHVGIDQNQTQIIFVDGVDGWIHTRGSGTLTQIVDANFPTNPIDVVNIDGYFIVPEQDTNQFYLSVLNDGTNWTHSGSPAFASMNSRPDVIIGLGTINRQLFIFGKQSTEVWQDAGTADFPFRRNSTVLPPYGCASVGSIAQGFGYLLFLAEDEEGVSSVIMARGTQFNIVSPPNLDYQLSTLSGIDDAEGFIYKIDGEIFYQLNFTSANRTFVYNVRRQRWHELQAAGKNRHFANSHMFFQGGHYMTSYENGKLYRLSSDLYSDSGVTIPRERITTELSDPSNNNINVRRFQIDTLQGVGLANGKDEDPYVSLSISRDGGDTFGGELRGAVGKIGERRKRTLFRDGFGLSRSFVFKLTYYAQTKFMVLGSAVDFVVEKQ